MNRRVAALALGLALLGCAGSLHAQQAEVSASIHRTLAAWSAGRFDDFSEFFHPEARGFYLDGGPLGGAFGVSTMRAAHAAGFRAALRLEDLDVRVHGSTAVAAGYLVGSLTLPGGAQVPGTWRYSETRVRHEGVWKVVQFHFSPRTLPGR